MLKNYFKIFIKVASRNKLFTFLSLFGISLTIMFVMIVSMTIAKITNGTGPESDLKKIIFSDRIKTRTANQVKRGGYNVSSCGRSLSEDYLKKVKSAEEISMFSGGASWEFIFNGKYQYRTKTETDGEYWKVFNYKFLQGRPYTNEEVEEKANLAVITNSLKKLLYGNEENVLGKTLHYTSMDLIISGVVEDPPKTGQNAKGDLYFPYTLFPNNDGSGEYTGAFRVAFKATSYKEFNTIRKEVQETILKLDAADTSRTIFLSGPYTQFERMMVGYGDPEEYSLSKNIFQYLLIALAFLLLPAINLMALNFARIHERGEEIAVRKSFGAASSILRGQFLFENILMTLAGGVIGIILSYLVVLIFGDTLSFRLNFFSSVPLTFSFNILVFISALLACLLFGLFSGYMPAFRLSRMKPAIYLKGGEA